MPASPGDLAVRYEEDLKIADGELEARYPLSGKTARFRNKGSFQPDHDLERMVDYLEERYRALFDCAPDGIIITDLGSNCLDVNASICRMLGRSRRRGESVTP